MRRHARHLRPALLALIGLIGPLAAAQPARAQTLFDPGLGTPASQGWTVAGYGGSLSVGGSPAVAGLSTSTGGQYGMARTDQAHQGVELAFWTDRVWAYDSSFAVGATQALDTTLARHHTPSLQGGQYQLWADGQRRPDGPGRADRAGRVGGPPAAA